mgnify:CR=1 FL=1
MTEKKTVGAPRKTPEGGQRVTFYLPKHIIGWIRGKGGSKWIREQVEKEIKNENDDLNSE